MARPKKKKEDIIDEKIKQKQKTVNFNEPRKFEELSDEEIDIIMQYEIKTAPVFGKAGSSITMDKVKKKYGGAIFPIHQIPTMKRVIDNW